MTADIKSFMRLDMTNHFDKHEYELIEGFRLTDPPLYKLFIDGYSVSYSKYIIGPRGKKTCLQEFANNTGADQPAYPRSLISSFGFRFLESTIFNLARRKIKIF